MLTIKPVSDLRNRYPEIERIVHETGQPVFLTKNGYGSMVLMSLEQYAQLTEPLESKLDEADRQAGRTTVRLSHEEVFAAAKARIPTDAQ